MVFDTIQEGRGFWTEYQAFLKLNLLLISIQRTIFFVVESVPYSRVIQVRSVLVCKFALYVHRNTIWSIRLERLQKQVLNSWPKFSIWNAGKQGRRLYRCLQPKFQDRVVAFCDVDVKKVGKTYSPPHQPEHLIPILHFREVKPPVIICVKLVSTLIVLCKWTYKISSVWNTNFLKCKPVSILIMHENILIPNNFPGKLCTSFFITACNVMTY